MQLMINQNNYLEKLSTENKTLKEKVEYLEFKISELIKDKIAEKKHYLINKFKDNKSFILSLNK